MLEVIVLFGLLVTKVSCKYCYVCNSSINHDCLDIIDLTTTSIRPTLCNVAGSKYCIKTTGTYGGFVGTNRFCSSYNLGSQCSFISFPDHDRIYRACVFTCSGDLCNRATTSWFGSPKHHHWPFLLSWFVSTNLLRL
ncbi:hypothetical protein P879_06365 [Paragonimus westermani]|uniref:Protein sleepless n=1 Tax=Paragonimus westermani TaxID=34504 RepID=A0A8T0DF13_9TREM|nr:hypothetical protein P879_06365 [Paragonimus westermani]